MKRPTWAIASERVTTDKAPNRCQSNERPPQGPAVRALDASPPGAGERRAGAVRRWKERVRGGRGQERVIRVPAGLSGCQKRGGWAEKGPSGVGVKGGAAQLSPSSRSNEGCRGRKVVGTSSAPASALALPQLSSSHGSRPPATHHYPPPIPALSTPTPRLHRGRPERLSCPPPQLTPNYPS